MKLSLPALLLLLTAPLAQAQIGLPESDALYVWGSPSSEESAGAAKVSVYAKNDFTVRVAIEGGVCTRVTFTRLNRDLTKEAIAEAFSKCEGVPAAGWTSGGQRGRGMDPFGGSSRPGGFNNPGGMSGGFPGSSPRVPGMPGQDRVGPAGEFRRSDGAAKAVLTNLPLNEQQKKELSRESEEWYRLNGGNQNGPSFVSKKFPDGCGGQMLDVTLVKASTSPAPDPMTR